MVQKVQRKEVAHSILTNTPEADTVSPSILQKGDVRHEKGVTCSVSPPGQRHGPEVDPDGCGHSLYRSGSKAHRPSPPGSDEMLHHNYSSHERPGVGADTKSPGSQVLSCSYTAGKAQRARTASFPNAVVTPLSSRRAGGPTLLNPPLLRISSRNPIAHSTGVQHGFLWADHHGLEDNAPALRNISYPGMGASKQRNPRQ